MLTQMGQKSPNDETTEPVTLMHEIQNQTPAHSDRGWNNDGYVEVPGIEPWSTPMQKPLPQVKQPVRSVISCRRHQP